MFPKCGVAFLMDHPELCCIFRRFVYNSIYSYESGFHRCVFFFL